MYKIHSSIDTSLQSYETIIVKERLTIETKIIGYKKQGESILIFIRADEKIVFAALFDCFQTAHVNKVTDILNEYQVKKLDFICWTHPDNDHSEGLDAILEKYVDARTLIWIPEGVDEEDIKCSKSVQELFKKLKEYVLTSGKYHVYSASDEKNMLPINSICFLKGNNKYPLYITSYAPNSQFNRRQYYQGKFVKNDRSILCVLRLGDAKIVMTGDVEDGTLDLLPQGKIDPYVHILKIPHHGSDSSTKMMDICSEGTDVACTTVYRVGKNNLPLEEVMKDYLSISNLLFSTGKLNVDEESEQFGIVTILSDIITNEFDTKIEGNAMKL